MQQRKIRVFKKIVALYAYIAKNSVNKKQK